MKIKNADIKIIQADITQQETDAIVNAANNQLVMGGALALAIKNKGGKEIEIEALSKAPVKVGEAIATGAGKLKARFVIHAVTMAMDFKTDEQMIRLSCRNALKVADSLKLKSIALPALGCGTGAFPYLAAAKIMAQEIYRYLRNKEAALKEIIFCLYGQEAFDAFNQGVISYLKHVTEELQSGPFVTVDAIIEVSKDNEPAIIVIERSNPPFGFALPGGFVDYEESLEEAVTREAKEETGLELTRIKQFHTYSDPRRDPRFHTIGTVFIAQSTGSPKAGDDAAALKIVKLSDIENMDFAFDHKQIIRDYIRSRENGA